MNLIEALATMGFSKPQAIKSEHSLIYAWKNGAHHLDIEQFEDGRTEISYVDPAKGDCFIWSVMLDSAVGLSPDILSGALLEERQREESGSTD